LRAHRLPPNIYASKTFVLQWAMRQIQRSSDISYVKIFVAKNLFACSIQFIEIPEPSSPIPPRACTLTRAGMFDLKFTDSTFHNQCGAYQCWATALSSNRLSNANQTGTELPRRSGMDSKFHKRNEQTTVSPIGAILGAEGAFRPPNPSAPASGVISVPLSFGSNYPETWGFPSFRGHIRWLDPAKSAGTWFAWSRITSIYYREIQQ
jgi:hypothetical protein